MKEAYQRAYLEVTESLSKGGSCLDCGANKGQHFDLLQKKIQLKKENYFGIEWNKQSVAIALEKGFHVEQGDLNKPLPYQSDTFQCVFALSVLEHLLNGCLWIRESKRVLKSGGQLVILTPNISTFFTIALLLVGKMPSSGPYPDSEQLLKRETPLQVSNIEDSDVESDTPIHRHLIVFSYRVLKKYLEMLGFEDVRGYGFGLYPFPNFLQPLLEKIDPYHCHQMVFVATKSFSDN